MVERCRGRLRLRLPRQVYGGQQKYLSLSLPDSPENWELAEAKAKQIEADIRFERFDFSLSRYRSPVEAPDEESSLSMLWEQYNTARTPQLQPSSRKVFRSVTNKLESCPYKSVKDAARVKNWLLENFSPESARRTLQQLNACGNWAVEQKLILSNPFAKLSSIQRKRHRRVEPFSASEREAILAAFESSKNYQFYLPLVKFLFLTGCRPSEAIALRWEDIDPAMTTITFAYAIVEKQRKPPKNGKSRTFPLNEQLRSLLQGLPKGKRDQVLFPSPGGTIVDFHNFSSRAWKTVVGPLPFRYRSAYSCRHTFITECLRAGIPVNQVAEWVGNSPKVLLDHYAGLTGEDVPEF